jgi:hypothetical protein
MSITKLNTRFITYDSYAAYLKSAVVNTKKNNSPRIAMVMEIFKEHTKKRRMSSRE